MRPSCTALDTLPRRALSYCPSSTWILAIGMCDLLRLHVVVCLISDRASLVAFCSRPGQGPPNSVAMRERSSARKVSARFGQRLLSIVVCPLTQAGRAAGGLFPPAVVRGTSLAGRSDAPC